MILIVYSNISLIKHYFLDKLKIKPYKQYKIITKINFKNKYNLSIKLIEVAHHPLK